MRTKRNLAKRTINNLILTLILGLSPGPAAYSDTPDNHKPVSNQLRNHPSPYLALHGDDPVQWQDWDKAVIDRARKENKLIFISSGYFSCHWCHVMQRESYSDKAVAGQLNKLAVPVKIDRELQPALDAWLIDFTERTTGQSGWPLNVFLTPDGYPLVSMTYLPKENFTRVLASLQKRWNEDEAYLREAAGAAFESMKPAPQAYSGRPVNEEASRMLTQYLVRHALQLGDDIAGGFGEQNKFPMSPQLLALIKAQERYPDKKLAAFLPLTLDQMANLGLHDLIGGGFYRYVVDPGWDIPHFEKMLYDNAQLARVYLHAARVFNKPEYRRIAYTTLDFVLRDMRQPGSGYAASLSAVDDNNIEGGYYLWHRDELEKILDQQELMAAKHVWGADGPPHLEDGYHLKIISTLANAAHILSVSEQTLQETLESARAKLRQARDKRSLPVDNKVLAAWNGLLLTSLSEAAMEAGNQRYRDAAERLYHFLSTKLWDGKQLHRFLHQGNPGGQVSLEDYAYVAEGMLAWARLSGNDKAWNVSKKIALAGLKRFHNLNGWQFSEQLIIPYDARELVLADNTMPSSSAVLLEALLTIADHDKDDELRKKALDYIDPDYSELNSSPLWYATHISLLANAAAMH